MNPEPRIVPDNNTFGKLEPLTSYTWPTSDYPLATLGVRVDELATRLGLPTFVWEVDGLGPARGFGCRLPSGRVFLLEEIDYDIRHGMVKGPNIFVDAADLGDMGIESLLSEILTALDLSRSDVTWTVHPTTVERAASVAASVRDYLSNGPCILAELTFLPESQGGRRSPPVLQPWGENGWYMPHVVVVGSNDYLGVRFIGGPQIVVGVPGEFSLSLMYYPRVDYSTLKPGVSLTVREGGRIVATGRVLNSPPG